MINNKVKTFIIRFRDHVTPMGSTIEEHNKICKYFGYVWWGWWNKAGEAIPEDIYRRFFSKNVLKNKISIFLLDTGQKKIYKAICVNVEWKKTLERFKSPEVDKTPVHYRDQSFLAWFKLIKINMTPCNENIVKKYTYVRVENCFEDKHSKYIDFYGKQIYSLDELIQQNRSVWFIRDYLPEDPVHQICLFGRRTTEPCDFTKEYIQTTSRNLLWLSDLHYSDNNHNFPFKAEAARRTLEVTIEQTLKRFNIQDIAGVIISGDLTWSAASNEYKKVENLFRHIQSWANLDNYQLAVSPGNHDIAFSDKPYKKDQLVEYSSKKSKENFENFYRDIFYIKPNKYLCSGRRFLLNGIAVEIVCLNSSNLYQVENAFQGYGFLGDEQLDFVSEKMDWNKSTDSFSFRIVVVHHHLIPVIYRHQPLMGIQYSVALDADALACWIIKHKVNLVLHGHMHQPFLAKISRPISIDISNDRLYDFYILGMGSTGVIQKYIKGEVGCNVFGLLNFSKNKIKINFYKIDPINPCKLLYSKEINFYELIKQ